MERRITIVFKDDDPLYRKLVKYVEENYTTISGAVKVALQKMLNDRSKIDVQ